MYHKLRLVLVGDFGLEHVVPPLSKTRCGTGSADEAEDHCTSEGKYIAAESCQSRADDG